MAAIFSQTDCKQSDITSFPAGFAISDLLIDYEKSTENHHSLLKAVSVLGYFTVAVEHEYGKEITVIIYRSHSLG